MYSLPRALAKARGYIVFYCVVNTFVIKQKNDAFP